MSKVTVVGAGHVGAALAVYIAEKKFADVILIDIADGLAAGRALDQIEAGSLRHYDTRIEGTTDLSQMAGSDVVVITAGQPRKPGMSRDDLLIINAKIIKSISEEVARYAPNAVVILVTNPLDVMCYVALKVTGFALKKVVGMAGILDSTRFRYFVSSELGVSVANTSAMVLGGHGDSMVPLPRYSTVCGIPVSELITKDKLDKLIERTRKGGAEIVSYLKTGSAYWAPGASTAEMVEAIIKNKMRILPCSAYLRGEYGIDGLFIGVPVKLGANGVHDIIELDLTPEERDALHVSASAVSKTIAKLEESGIV